MVGQMKRRERAYGGQTEGTCRADKREREQRRERERGINDEEWQLRYLSASCDAGRVWSSIRATFMANMHGICRLLLLLVLLLLLISSLGYKSGRTRKPWNEPLGRGS